MGIGIYALPEIHRGICKHMIVFCPAPEQLKGGGYGCYEEAEPKDFPTIGKECRNRVFDFHLLFSYELFIDFYSKLQAAFN